MKITVDEKLRVLADRAQRVVNSLTAAAFSAEKKLRGAENIVARARAELRDILDSLPTDDECTGPGQP